MSKEETFVQFGNSSVFFFRISSCCYGYCDQYCDWWIRLSGLNMVALTVRLQQTVRLRLNRMISEE